MTTVSDALKIEREFFAQKLSKAELDFPAPQHDADEADRVNKLLTSIFLFAIHEGALQVLFAETEQDFRLRFRSGCRSFELPEMRIMPRCLQLLLMRRLKIMAGCDPDKITLEQDGRIRLQYQGRNFDLLTYIYIDRGHEACSFEVLDSTNALRTPQELGMTEEHWKQVETWLNRPHGLIVVTASAGKGATSNLYALLRTKIGPDVRTFTIEDPISYFLPHTTQAQISETLSYADAIRGYLTRQPDLIFCDQARDPETLNLLLEAARERHLVLTRLHTVDAPSVISRMVGVGAETSLVASALIGAIGTMNVCRICAHCREQAIVSSQEFERLNILAVENGFELPRNSVFYLGKGCDKCYQTGYKGFISLYELMEMSPALQEATSRYATWRKGMDDELTQIAIADGMTTFAADGIRKALAGATTIDELFRVFRP